MAGKSKEELTEEQQGWLAHVRGWMAHGGTMKAYAEVHGLELKKLYHWKRWLDERGLLTKRAATPQSRFRPLAVVREPDRAPVCRVVFPNGILVEWHGPLSASLAGTLLKTVGGLS